MPPAFPLSLEARRNERPYFDHRALPSPLPHYVVWLDVMGSQGAMRRSLPMSTNFVMKLHIACQRAKQNHDPRIELFPVIDGVYVTSPTLPAIRFFVKEVMSRIALTFIFETDPKFRFMVRGALAFGPISKGSDLPATNEVFNIDPNYTSHIVLGPALAQAYEDERRAAPFGIFTSESARMFAPPGQEPIQGIHMKWWHTSNTPQDNELLAHLKLAVGEWFEWASRHSGALMYSPDRMAVHRSLFEEYFSQD